jgi:hypothetical protein
MNQQEKVIEAALRLRVSDQLIDRALLVAESTNHDDVAGIVTRGLLWYLQEMEFESAVRTMYETTADQMSKVDKDTALVCVREALFTSRTAMKTAQETALAALTAQLEARRPA